VSSVAKKKERAMKTFLSFKRTKIKQKKGGISNES
jgi:hypothetical protein